MPVTSMARIAARRAGATSRDTPPSRPTATELLKTIGAYIPTDVTAFYVPIAAGMVAAEASDDTKHAVGIGVAVLAAFTAWVLAQRAAVEPKPGAGATLKAGWYEILVAGVAMYIWALSMPGSWVDFGKSALFVPALIVGVASFIFGGLATLLNRPQR